MANPKSERMLCSGEMRLHLAVIGVAAAVLCTTACRSISGVKNEAAPIVGTWLVKAPEAPILRNNVVEKLTLRLPIHIRDVSRPGSVWRSHVKSRIVEQLA